MELHTLGVNGGYSQADVTALAHILTGWGLQRRGQAGMRMGAAGMSAPETRTLREKEAWVDGGRGGRAVERRCPAR